MSAFQSTAAALWRLAKTILIVAAILLCADEARKWIQNYGSQAQQWPTVETTIQNVDGWLGVEVDRAEVRYGELQVASPDQINRRRAAVAREMQALAEEPRLKDRTFPGLVEAALRGELEGALKADLKLRLLEQEAQALITLSSLIGAIRDYNAARSEVEKLRLQHVAAHEKIQQNHRERKRIVAEHPETYWMWGTPAYFKLKKLEQDWSRLNQASWDAFTAWDEKGRAFRLLPNPGVAPPFKVERRSLQGMLDPLHAEVDKIKSTAAAQRSGVASSLWMASVIVLLAMASGVLFKGLLFFVLAPIAGRVPPMRLLPSEVELDDSRTAPVGSPSEISMKILLDDASELLVKSDYLQSAPGNALTTTQLLLSGRYPFASLASGMWLLTRVRFPGTKGSIVVSSTTNPFDELTRLELADGEAVVVQPQHLVGLVHRTGQPVHLSSMWRLTRLHAWLTLQFRYLVFRGPAALLVKGCRGVRVESAEVGRTVSQAATIGFSADLGYSTVRSETFTAYVLGRKALFNDRFTGTTGYFVYQEIPSTEQRGGFAGRSLQGLMDGVLKAFGI